MKKKIKNFIQASLVVIISVLIIFTVAKAGDITPPSGTPTAKFYTLMEIFDLIDKNDTTATEGTHNFDFDDALTGTHHTLTEIYSALAGLISADQVKLGTTYLGVTGTYITTYTWTKEGAGSWEGVNEDLDWAKEIGGTDWWNNITYSYCGASACTNDGTVGAAASHTGPPGGWNGSNDYTNFDNSALHNYEVITADSTDLGDCTADAGDLVFPDGSVWDKSATNSYSVTLTGCDVNDSNAASIWSAAGGSGSQYAYARNAPSALSIADAWDRKKNLTDGENNTHSYTQDGKNNDYYDRPGQSWYADTEDGVGTSRLPMIKEYERARQGTSSITASLLWGTTNWNQYNWSVEQYPAGVTNARDFNPSSGHASYTNVNYKSFRLWVVVVQ